MTRRNDLDLVGAVTAAKILGVPSQYIPRLRRSGRLHGIPVEGTTPVYSRAEVRALAKQMASEGRGHDDARS